MIAHLRGEGGEGEGGGRRTEEGGKGEGGGGGKVGREEQREG